VDHTTDVLLEECQTGTGGQRELGTFQLGRHPSLLGTVQPITGAR
jgi:hypothetical protein